MRLRTFLVVSAVLLAFLAALLLAGTVAYDLWALQHGWRTISDDTMRLSLTPLGFVLIVLFFGDAAFLAGCLFGHLVLYQVAYIERTQPPDAQGGVTRRNAEFTQQTLEEMPPADSQGGVTAP